MIQRIQRVLLALCVFVTCLQTTLATTKVAQYITYQNPDGETVYLLDDRRPALYTGDFGDCLGHSQINVSRFDAAYYKDNMTVLFHLEGDSGITNSSIMLYIGVFAYGESRFDLIFNPCSANINSLCPVNSSIPIEASGIIPVAPSDVAGIPAIALSIPDFEGQAILRIFDNTTQSEIGCYSAVVTNGASFSHPAAVGSVLGVFTLIAVFASFLAAAYGEAIPTMRLHYAHSLSVGVVFAVFQHIFYTGAISANWPSVLVAWWSNFAWSGGMIPSKSMQNSIDKLIGNNIGNLSQVGAAAAGSNQDNVAGGLDLSLIYKRATNYFVNTATNAHPLARDIASEIYKAPEAGLLKREILQREVLQRSVEQTLQKRAIADAASGFTWYGHPVENGLPLPGNYSGFAGTLATQGIRVSNAFMTGFLWFLILLVLMVAAVMAFKWVLEGLAHFKVVKQDRFKLFRDHWLHYSAAVALRTCYIGFFMMMFLTLFQFTYESPGGVKAIAAIVFIVFIIGIPGLAIYAILAKRNMDSGKGNTGQSGQVERKMLLGKLPWFGVKTPSPAENADYQPQETSTEKQTKSGWFKNSSSKASEGRSHTGSIHDNEEYTKKFGWLAARFRRTRWWFFAAWIFYEFLRAIFYAGASGYPLAQIFGLLVVETLAFVFIIFVRPFEGRRLNLLVVYALGFSKVTSVGLSAAFDSRFNLPRITTTAIGIVIVVIQGILTILTMIAIVVGAISSYMSVSRNHATFKPKGLAGVREKYFNHLDRVVEDVPRPPKVKAPKKVKEEPVAPQDPYFKMSGVRRVAKIEDEDEERAAEVRSQHPGDSQVNVDMISPVDGGASVRSGTASPAKRSRAGSRAASIQNYSHPTLPFGARQHRTSWSTRDFQDYSAAPTVTSRDDVPDDEPAPPSPTKSRFGHRRTSSRQDRPEASKLKQHASNDELRVGGDVSTRDTIGMVPTPTVRPRASTFGSRISSRGGTPPPDETDEGMLTPVNPTGRTHAPLTPALEKDEYGFATPKPSTEQ